MPTITKILFPVDFSGSCLGAARYVEALAGRFEAAITLLHVVGMGEHNLAGDLLPRRQEQLDAFLADELKYFTVQRQCIGGDDAAAEIVKAARSLGVDLVMLPSHGLGTFRRLLLGSVTAKVLHDLDCPVWTSVHSEAAPPLEQIQCRRVLCAVDLSDRSQSVLEWGAWIAREYQAELEVVHATPEMPPEFHGWRLIDEFVRFSLDHAKTRIGTLQAGAGTDAGVVVSSGDPAKVVVQAARDFNADLLVIGRHSGTGLAGYLNQHAYAVMRDSPCPVISI